MFYSVGRHAFRLLSHGLYAPILIGCGTPDHVPNTANPKPSRRSCSSSLMHCIQVCSTQFLIAASSPSTERKRTVPAGARRRVGFGCPYSKSQPETVCGRDIAIAFKVDVTPLCGSCNQVG